VNWSKNAPREPVQLGIKIQVDAVAMMKFWHWVDMAKGEVSALGLVDEIRDADTGMITALLVTDFFLVKQECSIDETTMDPAAVAQLIADLENQNIDSRKLRCWTHSHGSMSVFWSGTDDENINGLANGEYLLSLVVNKKRDTMCRLDQYNPCHLYLSDVVWEVYYPLVDGLAEACFAEFKAKVNEGSVFGNGKITTVDQLLDLKAAQERGAITDHDLDDELNWLGLEREDLEEQQPF
jgi:hypothetical protein